MQKKNLSPKRDEHTCNVRKLAVKLARPTARTKAALAALLHDIAKRAAAGQIIADIYRKCYNSW